MSPSIRLVTLALPTALLLTACTDHSPDLPTQPGAGPRRDLVPDQAALQAQIATLINALYAPKDQGRVFADFARIKAQIAAGRTDGANDAIVSFFKTALADLKGGVLQDPNGSQPPSTADALRSLLNDVAQIGGLAAPIPESNPLSGDGAVAVVGQDGGTVVTSSGYAGVRFPAGALPGDVIVVIARLPNPAALGQGPLPTDFDQYPLFYDYSTTPTVSHFEQPATVALCRLEVGDPFGPPDQTVADRLQVAHPDPADPNAIELLPRVDGSFISCAGVGLASAATRMQGGNLAARMLGSVLTAGSKLATLFAPTPAYAVHGGLGGLTSSFSPFASVDPGRLHFTSVTAGERHTCALTVHGEAWCWGENSAGAIGDGSTTTRLVPTEVASTLRFTKLSANNAFTCGLATDSRAYCWGLNRYGALGTGDQTSRTTPAAVMGGHTFVDIGTGLGVACGLTSNGEVWCWGFDQYGQLGASSAETCSFGASQVACSTVPVRAAGSTLFSSLAVGFWNVCGVSGGQALCWGVTGFSSGNPVGSITPAAVPGNVAFTAIARGSLYGCGIDASSRAWCWGANSFGQLGDGTTTSAVSPMPVSGGFAFAELSAKNKNNVFETTCGVTGTGDAYCWGAGASLELGATAPNVCNGGSLGSIPCALAPVHVSGSQNYTEISVGGVHVCAVTQNHAIYCWGSGTSGQLGTGNTDPAATPTPTIRSF